MTTAAKEPTMSQNNDESPQNEVQGHRSGGWIRPLILTGAAIFAFVLVVMLIVPWIEESISKI
jgi:hypothetical protein